MTEGLTSTSCAIEPESYLVHCTGNPSVSLTADSSLCTRELFPEKTGVLLLVQHACMPYSPMNLAKNSRVRVCRGLVNTSLGSPCSQMTPSAMNTTWLDTSRAKAISWVTTSMVMP